VVTLSKAEFSLVPSQEYEQIRQREIAQVGGLFDPITGKADTAKAKLVPIPPEQILTNKERNLPAVNIALEPLVNRAPSAESQKEKN